MNKNIDKEKLWIKVKVIMKTGDNFIIIDLGNPVVSFNRTGLMLSLNSKNNPIIQWTEHYRLNLFWAGYLDATLYMALHGPAHDRRKLNPRCNSQIEKMNRKGHLCLPAPKG